MGTRNISPKHSDPISQSVKLTNGVVSFLGTWGKWSQWPPLQKLWILKNYIYLFIFIKTFYKFWVQITHFCISNINFAAPWTLPPEVTSSPPPKYNPEFDHLPPCSTNIKNEWSYNSVPRICLHCVDRDNIIFTLTRWQMSDAWGPSNKASLSEVGEQINIIFISLKMDDLGIIVF